MTSVTGGPYNVMMIDNKVRKDFPEKMMFEPKS